jgi:2'-5' RNA ligase
MPRIFTGLEIPAEIGRELSALRGGLPGARWIDPENYHVTLRGGRRPRALVATLAQTQALMDLQAEHERLMRRVGLDAEGRKYTPHVTLARLRESSSRQVADYLSARALFGMPSFKVARFVLFSARASVGGGPYVVEAAYPLAA